MAEDAAPESDERPASNVRNREARRAEPKPDRPIPVAGLAVGALLAWAASGALQSAQAKDADDLSVTLHRALRSGARAEQVVEITTGADGANAVAFAVPAHLDKIVLRAPKSKSKECVTVFAENTQAKQYEIGAYIGDLDRDWAPVAAHEGSCTLDPREPISLRDFDR